MRLRTALLGSMLLASPLAARAQPIQGLYVSGGAGAVLAQDVHAARPGDTGRNEKLRENLGLDVTGSVGYALGNGFRFELEGDWLRNGVKDLTGTATPLGGSGRIRRYGFMANALFDFDIRSRYVFPYAGVGAGYMWTRLDSVSFTAPGGGPGSGSYGGGTSGSFAWQAIAGLAFPVPNMPGLSLLAQYRFLDITAGQHFSGTAVTTGGVLPSRLSLNAQFSHTFLVGLRYAFNVAPPAMPATAVPAPVAAPAPAPARSYLVFFDWDKATLTDRARQIVREAADNAQRVQYTRIEVNGYTDRSGSARYNRGLSVRRARAVAAELVRDGVARSAITVTGFGETHPLVPTANGVREPQNRRVEIIIR